MFVLVFRRLNFFLGLCFYTNAKPEDTMNYAARHLHGMKRILNNGIGLLKQSISVSAITLSHTLFLSLFLKYWIKFVNMEFSCIKLKYPVGVFRALQRSRCVWYR